MTLSRTRPRILTAETGKQVSHGFAKELIAGFAGAEVDKLAETKGLDFLDREKAKHHTKRQAEHLYEEQYGQYTRNIPISELGLHLSELRRSKKIYISCLSGFRSAAASKTLSYVGLLDVVNVSGGFKAWANAGSPVPERPHCPLISQSGH